MMGEVFFWALWTYGVYEYASLFGAAIGRRLTPLGLAVRAQLLGEG